MKYIDAKLFHLRLLHRDLNLTHYILADFICSYEKEDGVLYSSFVHREQETSYYYWTILSND